ncbi:methionine ABC transporter substrate-binding protein [Corynebacterium sp. 13CS0277]|uniref:MetQ/NlpA family ABC transporter substrate-binding protein n=1 Tax=Corynebacterium sp. 13CS0277 TaxID=2071994 RepID=UPI000D03035B|nr:MetQ/NlpA family ABC transporter substrate-binding protein [Corynebacterium sp. 13CS0277]PRQ11379.1 methionine ABC transporter substrate-binding protein [Corynebacterium sp. 13CS0277]
MNIRKLSSLALAGALSFSLAACANDSGSTNADGSEKLSLRVGTTEAGSKAWDTIEDNAKAAGLDLEVVPFSDYTTPNKALSEGTIDANAFQHLKFLAGYNVGEDAKLVPVASTYIVPLSLYWKGHDSLDGIEGETVVIPNDPSNQGRALKVLEGAGLVTLKDTTTLTPTPADIDEAASKVKVNPLAAEQTTVAYGEGKPAIINNNFLGRAGIDPAAATYKDDPNNAAAEPYINVIAVKEGDEDSPAVKKFIEVYQSQDVKDAQAEDTNGTSKPVDRPVEELKEILRKLEDNERNAK